MYKTIYLQSWNRKEIYEFFSSFEEPYFGITAEMDVTKMYLRAKANEQSIFQTYLHDCLKAIQKISALKLRIEGDQVVEYDSIHASATINRMDGTFGFSFIEYDEDFKIFRKHANLEAERIQNSTNLFPNRNGNDCIHFSALPWINFTALTHARAYKIKDCVPKISVGKILSIGQKKTMPCSIHLHHGLADGRDAGLFFEYFQKELDREPII
jgi:chloramphenicol O-acetyltransferase type A